MEIFFATSLKILILLNPFAVLSTFLSLTAECTPSERLQISLKSGCAVIVSGVLLFFCGQSLFSLLGINIPVFKVGGGIILMICAIRLVWGDGSARRRGSARESHGSIAVVPIAIPMAVGPGTAAGLILIGLERGALWNTLSSLLALGVATLLLTTLLALGTQAERLFRQEGIQIITKLTGLFLSAIAAKMILEGVRHTLS